MTCTEVELNQSPRPGEQRNNGPISMNLAGGTPVDVEQPGSWPAAVLARATELANALRGTTDHVSDLQVPDAREDEFRALLSCRVVRAYHATRLLDHEVSMIEHRGLRLLSVKLLSDRIEAAFSNACITATERDYFHAAHVFATHEDENRRGQTCLFLGTYVLREDPDLLQDLLGIWGGEGLYMTSASRHAEDRLRTLGRPAVVVVDVDLSAGWSTYKAWPGLQQLFAGTLLGLQASADVFYSKPVPPRQVRAIWLPGNQEYDKFKGLPRA